MGWSALTTPRKALWGRPGSSSALAAASGVDPAELARRVASPGGTTEAGLKVLDADDAVLRLVAATLQAAADRGAEMAAAARAG